MTSQFNASTDPALEPFLNAVNDAEHWINTATTVSGASSDRALAVADVHARLAQAHAANRVAMYLGDVTSLLAELCLQSEHSTHGEGS